MLIEYKLPNLLTCKNSTGDVVLTPGMNSVSTEAWEVISQYSIVKHFISEKSIVVVNKKDSDDLSSIASPAKAVELVQRTFDVKLLAHWEKNEKRPTVSDAIKSQSAKLRETDTKEDTKAETQGV